MSEQEAPRSGFPQNDNGGPENESGVAQDKPNAKPTTIKGSTIGSIVISVITLAFAAYLISVTAQKTYAMPPVEKLRLPAGFKVTIYSDQVPGARAMALSPEGTLYVGTTADTVYALPDKDRDGKPDKVCVIARGLNHPNGVAVKNGALYVGEIHRILRYDNIESSLESPPKPVVVTKELPSDEWHGNRYIRFGPDDMLYVGVGAPCNVCEKDDPRFGSLMRFPVSGGKGEVFARGIRNTVGFDWHPKTREVWFTDNGRDYLGDNLPPDELNRAGTKGLHFGFPYRYGDNKIDPEFGYKGKGEYVPPAMPLSPHVAALGMRFYTGNKFPPEYLNKIFIAEHGSWNRSKKLGYRIMAVSQDGTKGLDYKIFCDGFLEGDEAWGRPVDLCIMPDGSMLVSDDRCGAVYRIEYSK